MILVDSSVWIDYFEGFNLLHDDHDFDPIASYFPLKISAPR